MDLVSGFHNSDFDSGSNQRLVEVKGLDLLLEAFHEQQGVPGVRAEIQLITLHRVIEHAQAAAVMRVEREMGERFR